MRLCTPATSPSARQVEDDDIASARRALHRKVEADMHDALGRRPAVNPATGSPAGSRTMRRPARNLNMAGVLCLST